MLRIIYAFNVAKWKRPILKKYFKNSILKFIPLSEELRFSNKVNLNKLVLKRTRFLVWGMKEPHDLIPFAQQYNIPIWRVEDGFVRSIGLGSEQELPYSLCIDKTGIYFNAKKESDLESIILNHKKIIQDNILQEADKLIDKIKTLKISKYNDSHERNYKLATYDDRKKVLVIGQVEDDQSIIFGTDTPLTNVDLIELAIKENPTSDVFYKAHPDYEKSRRTNISDSSIFEEIYEIPPNVPLNTIFEQIDHIYTISSLGGFEALLYDKKVTVLGSPFYSGWGLTDDRHNIKRRNISVSLRVLFAAAYMIYPTYINPNTGNKTNLNNVLDEFKSQLDLDELYGNYKKEVLYNAKTKTDINTNYLKKHGKITIISDNVEILRSDIIKNKEVTIAFITDALTKRCCGSIPKNVTITSLPKLFSTPLSAFEKESVISNDIFDKEYFDILNSLELPWSKDISKVFSFDFKEYIYQENVKFLAVQKLGGSYEPLVLSFDDESQSIRYHKMVSGIYTQCDALDNLYFLRKNKEKDLFKFKSQITPITPFSSLKTSVNSLYHSLSRENESEEMRHTKNGYITVVGNINERNYAYSPLALYSIQRLAQRMNVFYIPVVHNEKTVEENKYILNAEGISGVRVCKSKIEHDSAFDSSTFVSILINSLLDILPSDYVCFMKDRIERYFIDFASKLNRYLYLERCLVNSKGMLSCFERSFVSRLVTELHHQNNKNTFALQPQIISSSSRFCTPTVKYMGAIDTHQKSLFENLDFPSKNIKTVGSVNILDRLDLIASDAIQEGDFLFVMQHSMYTESASALVSIQQYFSKNENVRIYIKPHPHQEVAVLELLTSIGGSNIIVLGKNADTYEYVSKCTYILGMFSSVLFESILSKKKVIIFNYNSLDPSINFASLGLALEVSKYDEFEDLLNRIKLDSDSMFSDVNYNINDFLLNNPQFFDQKALSSFIDSLGN